jgi:hypothetical protein
LQKRKIPDELRLVGSHGTPLSEPGKELGESENSAREKQHGNGEKENRLRDSRPSEYDGSSGNRGLGNPKRHLSAQRARSQLMEEIHRGEQIAMDAGAITTTIEMFLELFVPHRRQNSLDEVGEKVLTKETAGYHKIIPYTVGLG